jgi:hypothetical protein
MATWLSDLVEEAGSLVEVRGERLPGDSYAVLDFMFVGRGLRLRCNADTDEVVIDPAADRDVTLADLTADAVFAGLRGKVIVYAWCLSNHRGYRDAFQMRLLNLEDRSEETRQFEVAASAMRVLSVAG